MRQALLSLAFAAFLVMASSGVYASSFTTSVTPSSLYASTPTVLNFTITNSGAQSITDVNITLPSGFTYAGTPNPATATNYTTIFGNVVSWSGVSVPGSSTAYFSFSASAGVIGSFNFNVSALDSALQFYSANTTNSVMVTDNTPPTFSNNYTAPASPATYASGAVYTFNISWGDNIAVSTVVFNWNGGANQTLAFSPSGSYGAALADLAAGQYTYQWYASDTSGNWNTTGTLAFNVTQAPNTIDMYLNGALDQNISIPNGASLTVTPQSRVGTVYLYNNGVFIGSGSLTFTSSPPLTLGYYTFMANATGNQNYSANDTGASYGVRVVYPSPQYSIITSIPSSYSTSASTWSATWSDANDPNGFNTSIVELNYTGTPTNYTMTRTSGTNTSTYSVVLPSGTYYWKIYGNNLYDSWNSTDQTIFTVGKAIPSITLTITPSGQVFNYTSVTATCTASTAEIPLSLYKNFTSVANPYTSSIPTGYYEFDCNNTATQNYTTSSATQYLTVLGYSTAFDFVPTPPSITMLVENTSNTTSITVKDTGTEQQTINFTIDGLTPGMWSSSSGSVTLTPGSSGVFVVTFNTSNVTVGEYRGAFKAFNANRTASSNFVLRVTPNDNTKAYINATIADYSSQLASLEAQINASVAANQNVTAAENLFLQLKSKVTQAQAYLSSGDYFNAYLLIGQIKSLQQSTSTEVSNLSQAPVTDMVKTIGIAMVVVAVIVILVYLFWPTKSSYSLRSGFAFKPKKEGSITKIVNGLTGKKDEVNEVLVKPAELKDTLDPSVGTGDLKDTLNIRDKDDYSKE